MSPDPHPRRFDDVPVFPLPGLVLFPGTTLPLHVFERRYRELMADCLRVHGRKLVAVAQLQPGWEPLYEGRPPFYEVAGIGEITAHVKNSDGTYDVLLAAIARVRLCEQDVTDRAYRRASATVLCDHGHGAITGAGDPEVAALQSLAARIGALVRRELPAFTLQANAEDSPSLLADRIADQLVLEPATRQALLETLDVGTRVRQLTTQLTELYSALRSGRGRDDAPPTLH